MNRSQTVAADVWLDDGQQQSWRAVVSLLTTLPAALESELRRTAGLTMFDYTVLVNLSEAPKRTLQMTELANRASASLSRLSHVVTRLEKKGWVTREVCPADARATNAVLTKSGWEKLVATAPDHVLAVRDLVINALSPAQFQQLGTIAMKIGRRIEAQKSAS